MVKNGVSITGWEQRTSMSYCRNDGKSKDNLHFDNQIKEIIFLLWCFLKEMKHVLYVSVELQKHL